MAQKIRTEWYIREYRMKNGICEKTKFPVRVEGEHPNRTSREYKRQVRRAEKNATEAKNTAARIVNNNFLAGLDMTDLLTYSDEGMERLVMKAGTDGEEIFETVRKKLEGERLRALMYRSLKRRDRLVLSLRFGLEGAPPMTQQQVADRIDISRSYISRIEKKAVMKLRLALLEEGEGADAPWGGALGKKDL